MDRLRVCVEVRPASLSQSIHRVARALRLSAPSDVRIVRRSDDADLVVHHVVGLTGIPEVIAKDAAAGRDYAMVQYCLRTTEDSRAVAWLPIWEKARAVWSYYDLNEYLHASVSDEPMQAGTKAMWSRCKFYLAPLGVDGDAFKPSGANKAYAIGTSGYVAESEGVYEAQEACRRSQRRMFHLGPRLTGLAESVTTNRMNLTDSEVAEQWSRCSYVAALRRTEGFELPALEGLACGSRAVAFDAPHYRQWFGEHAEYVPEADHFGVVEALTELFHRPVRSVSKAERDAIVEKFNWHKLARPFWDVLLSR